MATAEARAIGTWIRAQCLGDPALALVDVHDDLGSRGTPEDTAAATRTTFPMSWRLGEVWLDTNVLWFREQPRTRFGAPAPAAGGAVALPELPRFGPAETGLDASRRRRLAVRAARRRRRATRAVPAVALVVGSATMLPIAALRHRGGTEFAGPVPEDPPSLILREQFGFDFRLPETEPAEPADTRAAKPVRVVAPRHVGRPSVRRPARRRHAASCRGARLGDVEPGHRLEPQPPRSALRPRAHDPGDPLRGGWLSRGASKCAAGRRRRHQLPRWREDGSACLPSERARRGRLLPAARPAHKRADQDGPDRPPTRAGHSRPLRRRRCYEGLRGLLDRSARSEWGRRALPEPREPHARPLPGPWLTGVGACCGGNAPGFLSVSRSTGLCASVAVNRGRRRRSATQFVVDGLWTESRRPPLMSLPERRRPVPQPVFKTLRSCVHAAGDAGRFLACLARSWRLRRGLVGIAPGWGLAGSLGVRAGRVGVRKSHSHRAFERGSGRVLVGSGLMWRRFGARCVGRGGAIGGRRASAAAAAA